MGNFANVVVTDAGRQLINQAIAGGVQVTIANAQVGGGYPASTQDPRTFTAIQQHVMDASLTSANYQTLYQTTVRITISSGYAPYQFQLNEIGVFAAIGTGTPTLFAYASSAGQGDYITPDPSPTPVEYDYAILIQYEGASPVNATVTIQPVIQLHGATHRGNGIDPIGLADTTASGLLMSPPNDPTKVLLGTVPQSFGPIPLHAPTHLDNGTDPIPVATTARTGSMTKLSGNQVDVFHGDGTWAALPPVPAGVVWEFCGTTAPTGWLFCDGAAISRATYATLFGVIGTTFGAGDGTNTFNKPDCRGRVIVGAGQGAGLTNRALAAVGGEETHVLTSAEMPVHTHVLNDPGHIHMITDPQHAHNVYDPTHAHSVADPTHTHPLSDPGHAHTFPGARKSLEDVSGDDMDVDWPYSNVNTNPAFTGIGIGAAATGIGINASPTGIGIYNAATNISINSHITNITLQNSGGSSGATTAHNTMPPFVALNLIIKT